MKNPLDNACQESVVVSYVSVFEDNPPSNSVPETILKATIAATGGHPQVVVFAASDELEILLDDDDDPQQGQPLSTTVSPGFGISSILLPGRR